MIYLQGQMKLNETCSIYAVNFSHCLESPFKYQIDQELGYRAPSSSYTVSFEVLHISIFWLLFSDVYSPVQLENEAEDELGKNTRLLGWHPVGDYCDFDYAKHQIR